MTISSPDDDDPRKGIAAVTSLGRTKKKAGLGGASATGMKEEMHENGSTAESHFIAISDATKPIDLNMTLRPSNVLPTSILEPSISQAGHTLDKAPKRFTSRQLFPTIPEKTPLAETDAKAPSGSHHTTPKKVGNPAISHSDPAVLEQTGKNFLPITSDKVTAEIKGKDYSMRSHMVTERIKFEILLDKSTEDVDVRTKALVIFGKLVNIDPSRKILAYHDTDLDTYPMLQQSHDLPESIEKWSKYISAPLYNPKAKKLQFHTRFSTVTSLLEMKRDSGFMTWLKDQKIFTSVMTLQSTENVRVGFFFGKSPHITNVTAFAAWIRSRLSSNAVVCPDFQLNVEIIGRYKDANTRTRAIVLICPRSEARQLRELLD
jgi:hypothetical protein